MTTEQILVPITLSQATTVRESRALTAADMRSQVNLVQEVMRAIMKEGTHYGTIPGSKKPSLYKPGAEVLAATFRIAVSYRVEDLSTDENVRYRVTAIGTHQTSGIILGEGMGECSSGEEKYKWRRALCDEEYDTTLENRRRIKFGKYQGKVEKTKQVRTEPADQANTILKMGCKRGQVAMTLNVVAASDIFNQDIEDLPEELRPAEGYEQTSAVEQPRAKTPVNKPPIDQPASTEVSPSVSPLIGDSPMKLIRGMLAKNSITEAELCAKFSIIQLEDLRMSRVNEVIAWVSNPS